jgi:hypothetical protein
MASLPSFFDRQHLAIKLWLTNDYGRNGKVILHLAGDIAAAEFGEVSLIASDLLSTLPKAFLKIQA